MAINQTIWGNPESWHNTYIYDSTSMAGATILRCSRPKVPDFDGTSTYTSSQLITGITEQKIEKNKPIDKSMCPCGQDVGASHLHFIGVYTNRNRTQYPDEDIQRVTTIVNMGMRTTPINWCFFERRVPNTYGNRAFGVWRIENDTDTYRVWLPGSDNSTSPTNHTNGNYYVSPFLDYQLKSILLQIQVFRITGRNATTGIPTGSWISLESWKNDYSTDSIAGARLQMLAPSSNGTNLSQITYYSVSPASERGFGAMILDEIPVGETGYSISPSFMSFGIQGDGNGYIYLFDIIQNLYGDKSDDALTYGFLPCDGAFTSSETRTYRGTASPYGAVWQEVPYDDDTYESLMSMAALYGCYFTPTATKVFPIAFTHADLCLPIIDDNGIAHGDYTRGSENPNNDLYDSNKVQDKNYDPSAAIDPNTYSNITGFNSITSGATMTKRYVLDAANVDKLGDDLWTICGSLSSTDFEHFDGKLKDEFLTTNPIDSIISLQRFPFEIPHIGSAKAQIKLGKSTVSAEGYTTFNPLNTIVFSGKDIFPRFGDCFLDYEPYTSYEVYVPFCGTTKIRAADILGHTLNIKMQIDLFTGSCTAYIMADQLVIETLNGSCGVDQTLSGAQTATMNANIFNGILNQKAADRQETTTLAKMAFPTGWIPTILNPVGGYEKIESAKTQSQIANYEITHVNVPPHKIGAASPLLGWIQEFDARIIIYYPEGNVIDSTIPPSLNDSAIKAFGSVKGFATASPGTASNFHGYTQGTIIADSIPCTQSERDRIKQAFESGVFLP